ncbi:MAG: UDP-4-amino-4,6-dideoxy-N-acetyl-beta-L-altrosamine transaminase, partial [Bacteroidota bacterium]
EALRADLITQGPRIDAFERAFAEYIGARYAVAVANGTAALHLSALALGVGPQSRVITAPITFTASANCIRYCGGEIDFCDIDPATITLDIEAVRRRLAAAPRGTYQGLIPVDFAGYATDLEAFRELADEYGLWLLEDSCHAPGGFFTDRQGQVQGCGNGAYADLAIFSFHPVKHIACGEGGMITTNDPELYQKLLVLRTHGITKDPAQLERQDGGWYYEMHQLGYNYRLTDFQAALGSSQLQRAATNLARRRAIARVYDEAFGDFGPVELIAPPADGGHAYHLYVILTDQRKALYDHLRTRGIYAQIHYIPVHTQPYYRRRSAEPVSCPQAEAYYERCLSLPMYPTLSEEEQQYVIAQVMEFFNG